MRAGSVFEQWFPITFLFFAWWKGTRALLFAKGSTKHHQTFRIQRLNLLLCAVLKILFATLRNLWLKVPKGFFDFRHFSCEALDNHLQTKQRVQFNLWSNFKLRRFKRVTAIERDPKKIVIGGLGISYLSQDVRATDYSLQQIHHIFHPCFSKNQCVLWN